MWTWILGARAFLLAGFIFMATGGAQGQGDLVLIVRDQGAQVDLLCVQLDTEKRLEIEHLHSYDRFPVREIYRVLGPGRIVLERLLFRSLLNGQGFVYPGARVRADGWGEIQGISQEFQMVEFLMGSPDLANHTLRIKGQAISLARFIEPGTIVELRVEKGSCRHRRSISQEAPEDGN